MICHQFPAGSLPVISTLVSAGIIPRTGPEVEGLARTLTCVDVIPSTGAAVGGAAGGDDIWVETDGGEAVDVTVSRTGVLVGVISLWTLDAHPALRRVRPTKTALRRIGTGGF